MNSPVRVAVVGGGHLGRFHAQKFAQISDCKLVAVCDIDENKVKALATEVGSQPETDYKKLEGKVDAVMIASHTTSHFEIAQFFLSRGVHVHVEKPLTETVAQAQELCRIAKNKMLFYKSVASSATIRHCSRPRINWVCRFSSNAIA